MDMLHTPWFQRNFAPISDNGLLPGIIERLEGTPARLFHKIGDLRENRIAKDEKWSLRRQIGHLYDLEPLWLARAGQIANGELNLLIADLSNARTHQANHDEVENLVLIKMFEQERQKLITLLRNVSPAVLDNAAVHPRLGTPMRLVDLAYFVAEHDDHHLVDIQHLLC
jgi:uncharacterized damage-inducible protein DinB